MAISRDGWIEVPEYITPPGGLDLPADVKSNDLVFWNVRLTLGGLARLSAKLRVTGVAFVSKPGSTWSQIVRAPDGRAMQLDEVSAAAAAAPQR